MPTEPLGPELQAVVLRPGTQGRLPVIYMTGFKFYVEVMRDSVRSGHREQLANSENLSKSVLPRTVSPFAVCTPTRFLLMPSAKQRPCSLPPQLYNQVD